jgi:hypothetical protein
MSMGYLMTSICLSSAMHGRYNPDPINTVPNAALVFECKDILQQLNSLNIRLLDAHLHKAVVGVFHAHETNSLGS